jgi:hypothetical protein
MNKVIEILDSDEKKIFLEMDRYDKFHSLEVYKKLSETTLKDEIIYLKLALLHDCGKGKTSMITRVLHKFKIKTPLREHAERGYEKIKDIDNELALLIRNHHNRNYSEKMSVFQKCDDES